MIKRCAMTFENYTEKITELIRKDHLKAALDLLAALLKNSPLLDEAIVQSAQYNDVMRQIRMGVISPGDANISKNKIRKGILDLLVEMEDLVEKDEQIAREVEKTIPKVQASIQITNSKNVITGGQINVGGNLTIGDQHKD
jgi:hypothetical protein